MSTYKEIFGKPIKVLTGDPAPTPITYTVTVANPGSGNVYYIDGVQTPTLELYEGNTYNFNYSAATGHPFRFATAADAAGSTEYTTGVSVDSNITTIVVASGAPNLFYYCTNHSGMGGRALTPASPSEYEGQIWYNETTGKFRSVVASSAWASSAPLVGAARANVGSSGTQTASLSVGGDTPSATNLVEEYNGSGWATATNYPLSIQGPLVAGTQTSAVICGGYSGSDRTETFEYDGSSFSSSGALPAGRRALNNSGFGSQTAAVQSGGLIPGGVQNTSNEYDGSSWTAGNTINTNRYVHAGAGTLTAGIISSGVGAAPSYTSLTNVEEYNGTTFTAVNSMSTGHGSTAGSNQAPQTSLIVFGGNTTPGPVINSTESYDGTNWTTQPNMATARSQLGGSGSSSSSGLAFAGYTTAVQSITEEYNKSANVITAGAFAASGAMGTARSQISGFGASTDASIGAGGYQYGPNAYSNASEEYNGATFTATPNMPVTLGFRNSGGTTGAGIVFGGHDNTSPANTSLWDGSSYSNGPNIVDSGYGTMGNGSQTAAFMCGSASTPERPNTLTEEYNGSSWSSVPGALNTGRGNGMGVGSQTAGLAIGGASPNQSLMEEYNGTAWTAGHTLVAGMTRASAQGGSTPQDNTMVAGGNASPNTTAQVYNGTAWATSPSLSTGRSSANGMGAGNSASSMLVAGGNSPSTTASEKFTSGTTALNYKNISTS